VLVDEHWPSSHISVLALSLPVTAAYFPTKFHKYFKCNGNSGPAWSSTRDFRRGSADHDTIYLMSGSTDFLHRTLTALDGSKRVIVTIDWIRRAASRSSLQCSLKAGYDLLAAFTLCPLLVVDSASGGATDGQYLLGFGRELGPSVAPAVECGLPRTLRHVLDGGVEGHFRSVLKSAIPAVVSPARAVLLHKTSPFTSAPASHGPTLAWP